MWQLQKSGYACTVFGFKIDKFNDVPVALASTAEHIHMRIIRPCVRHAIIPVYILRLLGSLGTTVKGPINVFAQLWL